MEPPAPSPQPPAPVSLAQAFVYWLRLGSVSFGGPTGRIAIMHHDLVEKKRWISAAVCFGAGVALWRYKTGIIPVIAACGLAGLVVRMIALSAA